MFGNEIYIFGAKSTAIGAIRAIRKLYPSCNIKACIVSSCKDNPTEIEGIEVVEHKALNMQLSKEVRKKICILVATPIYVQDEIKSTLNMFGYTNVILLDSEMEEKLMGDYFKAIGAYKDLKSIINRDNGPKVCVYKVKHHADVVLKYAVKDESWVRDIQVGASFAPEIFCEITDNKGDNISDKNPVYCELTAFYSMWKGGLLDELNDEDYCGVFQYRRVLDVDGKDFIPCQDAGVEVILPYPMLHLPNIKEHHTRYTNEDEWNMLLQAVKELSPEYYADYERIFGNQYMYNYNMIITKKSIFMDFCDWLFPILFRTEQLCEQADFVPRKRYIAYFGESMMTWYFMHNQNKYNIVHTGRMLRK